MLLPGQVIFFRFDTNHHHLATRRHCPCKTFQISACKDENYEILNRTHHSGTCMEVLKFIADGWLLKKYTGLLKWFKITEPQPDKTELM